MAASYSFGPFRLDGEAEALFRGTEPVALGRRAVALLRVFVEHPGAILSRDALIEAAWPGLTVEESNLNVQIAALRRVLEETPGVEHRIDTLSRRGYRLVGPVANEPDDCAPVWAVDESPGLALPDKPSIAVLPFCNMSSDPEQDYFADGMAEEIITALSHCSSLFVIARNSSFTYKGKAVDVRRMGRELGVRYVLEGSVRRGGDRVRFTGQLVDTTTGVHIWADRFEGTMGDVFAIQDQFTENVVATIEPRVQQAEIRRLKHKPAKDLNAYDHLLRAQQREYEFTEEGHNAALHHLEQALIIDSEYAPAMALAAYCHTECCDQGWTKDRGKSTKVGLAFASRAVNLGKDDASAHWMAARATLRLQMDASRAKELASRSLQLNPNSAIACAIAGQIEAVLGNAEEALNLAVRAKRLSPRDPRGWYISSGMAHAFFRQKRYDEAAAAAIDSANQNPRSAVALRVLAACLAKQGRIIDAERALREALKIEPGLTASKLRERNLFHDEVFWREFSDGLRLAGLPE
jgi:TolB-like protein/Flp pilus assembly protein TadD